MKSAASFSVVLLTANIATAALVLGAAQSPAQNGLSDTEKWVAEEVAKTGEADLDEKYTQPPKRILSASFLEKLVTGELPGCKLRSRGVLITGGIVREELDLANEQVPHDVSFIHFQFMGDVSCEGTKFDGTVSFEKSTIDGDLSLNGAKVGNDCLLDDGTFKKGVDFTEADIRGQLVANNAKFMSPNDNYSFNGMTVRDLASFDGVTFEGPVDFASAIISGELSADNAHFNDKETGTSFDGMKISDSLLLNKAIFQGPVTFSYADIKGQLVLDGAEFRNKAETANFNSVRVGGILSVEDAIFDAPAEFTAANVLGSFYGNNAHFNDQTVGVDLSSAVIGRDLHLKNATFLGRASFNSASIGNNLNLNEAKFKSAKDTPDLSSVKVGNRVLFRNASFDGGISLIAGRIGDSMEAQNAHFNSSELAASFNTLKVARTMFLTNATFDGPVDFILAELDAALQADGAKFRSKEKQVTFNTMRVKGSCNFQKAVFNGQVDFTGSEIGMNFQADGARFTNSSKTVYLGINCARKGYFRDVEFAGPVLFVDSTFTDLAIDVSPTSSPIPKLDMSRASVHRQLELKHAKIHEFTATFLHVEGAADLQQLVVDKLANLAYGDFVKLDVSGSTWPQRPDAFQIQGMTYKTIRASTTDKESHKRLADLVDRAAFTSEVYGSLEQFFSRQGYSADADEVFINGKIRERKQYLQGFAWLGSWVLYILTGYGRHPIYVSGLCIILVALGCILFSKKNMELQTRQAPGDPIRVYNAFWYSLGLFLPFVDLQVDKLWKPKRSRTILRHYVRIHILLGWILIPILVAALTGLIK